MSGTGKDKGLRKSINGKKSRELYEMIVNFRKNTDLTVVEICEQVGIGESTYYDWLRDESELSEAIRVAEKVRMDRMRDLSRKLAFKRLEGHEIEEEKIEYERKMVKVIEDGKEKMVSRPEIKSKTVTKKIVHCGDGFLQYMLNNTDPENFKSVNHIDHTSKGKEVGGKIVDLGKLSDEALEELEKAAEGENED